MNVLELRQYTLHPGRRDEFIELFERTFVEPQEAGGMDIVGQFRDLDDPRRMVWLRGFSGMAQRADALNAFYGGPAWKSGRDAANATMLDSDNVLLLRPAAPDSGFVALDARIASGQTMRLHGFVTATIHYVSPALLPAFTAFAETAMLRIVAAAGARVLARFCTEFAENTFPALPVREDASVFVWFAGFADRAAYNAYLAKVSAGPDWRDTAPDGVLAQFARKPEVLHLAPTQRSRLRG